VPKNTSETVLFGDVLLFLVFSGLLFPFIFEKPFFYAVPIGIGASLIFREFFASKNSGAFDKLADVDGLLKPDEVAQSYWWIHNQPKTTWTQEVDLRPWMEKW
jgi:hypothetical protein